MLHWNSKIAWLHSTHLLVSVALTIFQQINIFIGQSYHTLCVVCFKNALVGTVSSLYV